MGWLVNRWIYRENGVFTAIATFDLLLFKSKVLRFELSTVKVCGALK